MMCAFPGCESPHASRFGHKLWICEEHWSLAVFALEVISDKLNQ